MKIATQLKFFSSSRVLAGFFLLGSILGCSHDPNVQKLKYLESGKRYENEGKYKEASIQFANALKADKNYGDAHYELGKSYLHLNMMQAGFNELLRTVDLSPANIQARIDLGQLALAGHQIDVADTQAKAILVVDSNNADAYALLADIDITQKNLTDAKIQIQHAISLAPNRAAFHTTLGMLEGTDAQTAALSQDELKKAIALQPTDVRAHMALAESLEKQGDKVGAEQQLLATVSAAPKNLQARIALGSLYAREGNTANAETIFRQATEDLHDVMSGAELLKNYDVGTGHLDHAQMDYAELVAKYPDSIYLKMVYAGLLITANKLDQASSVIAQLVKGRESDPQIAVLRGNLLLRQGKLADAYSLLQTASQNAPNDPTVKLWYGMAARATGDTSAAQQSFQDVLREQPNDLAAQRGLAEVVSQQNDMNQLRQIAEAAIASHPELGDGYRWRGTVEANAGQMDKASDDFQTSLQKSPNDSATLLELGQVRLSQHRFPDAKTLLEQAVAKDGNLRALHLLALSDLQAKQPDKALHRIQNQITISPQNSALYDELAMLQLNLKDVTGAATTAQKAMQLNPADSAAVKIYTEAEIASGNVAAGLSTWQQWVIIHPRDAQAFSILGMLEEANSEDGKAAEYYKKALDIDSNQAAASNNLAYLMVETGQNLDVALTLAQNARRSIPNSADTADTLAWVYFHKGEYESSRTLLEEALKTDPGNASIHYHLGMTYSKLNRKSDAQAQFGKAISLAPNSQVMKDASLALQGLG